MTSIHPEIVWFVNELNDKMKGGGKVPSIKRSKIVKPLLQRFKSVGWRDSVLDDTFSNLSDTMIPRDEYEFYRDEDIIKGFTNLWYTKKGFDSTIAKTLKSVGLSSSIARHLDRLYAPLRNTCYTDEQLIELTIQHQLGRFKPITSPDTTHYYRSDVLDTWIPFQNTQCFNIPHPCSKSLSYSSSSAIKMLPHNLQQNIHFFHATNWKGCLSILEAIRHDGPSRCLDFGLKSGFYISPSFKNTLEWGEKRSGGFSNEVAILVFSIPTNIPKRFKYINLQGDEWKTVVVESRLCTDDMYKLLPVDKADFVYGPMLANPNAVKEGGVPKMHNPPKYQLVSKSDIADRFLQSCIVGCLFFKKGSS